jgi:hypothetical protein
MPAEEVPMAIRTWTIDGDVPLTFTIHQPAVTIRCGDGPEVPLSPSQVSELYDRFTDADDMFHTEAAELIE